MIKSGWKRVYNDSTIVQKEFLDTVWSTLGQRTNPDNTETRVCWLGEQVTLPEALDRKKTVGSRTLGPDVGSRGIGVRIYLDDYTDVVKHILPELECKRRDQKIYEIRAVPP